MSKQQWNHGYNKGLQEGENNGFGIGLSVFRNENFQIGDDLYVISCALRNHFDRLKNIDYETDVFVESISAKIDLIARRLGCRFFK